MRKLLVFVSLFAFAFLKLSAEAPVSTIGSVSQNAYKSNVNITVSQFVDVASCNMKILYDPAIATAISVKRNPLIGGLLSFSVATPGAVTIGWSNANPVSLADNEVAFSITFTKANEGTTTVSFDPTYNNRNWFGFRDGDFRMLNDLPLHDYYFDGSLTWTVAPKTIAPHLTAVPNTILDVPITIQNFNNVGAVSLQLQFDQNVLEYQNFTPNTSFPALQVDLFASGIVRVSGYIQPPETGVTSGLYLADDDVLFTLHFNYLGGYTTLDWFDDSTSCEYADWPSYHVFNDIPQADFYIDGAVSEAVLANLNVKVFLEGLFNSTTGTMNKTMDYDPVDDELFEKFPGTVVDLITLELHDAADYGTPLYQFTDVELHSDGSAFMDISAVTPGNYFILIKHRNHMETVSANPVELLTGTFEYDFTTAASKAHGSNQTSLAAGVYGLYAGEIVKDGRIDGLDRTLVQTEILKLTKGYVPEDINGDGEVNGLDRSIVQSNVIRIILISTP